MIWLAAIAYANMSQTFVYGGSSLSSERIAINASEKFLADDQVLCGGRENPTCRENNSMHVPRSAGRGRGQPPAPGRRAQPPSSSSSASSSSAASADMPPVTEAEAYDDDAPCMQGPFMGVTPECGCLIPSVMQVAVTTPVFTRVLQS